MKAEELLKLYNGMPEDEKRIFCQKANITLYEQTIQQDIPDDFSFHQHWKDGEDKRYEPVIKHFQ